MHCKILLPRLGWCFHQRTKILLLAVLLTPVFSFSQTETIYGLVDGITKVAQGVKVTLVGTTTTTTTDAKGRFQIQLTEGHRELEFSHPDYLYKKVSFPANVHLNSHTISLDLKEDAKETETVTQETKPLPPTTENKNEAATETGAVQPTLPATEPAATYTALGDSANPADAPPNADNIPTVSISDDDGKGDDGGQSVSSVLGASRDIFISTASFVFSQGRFRIRGYEAEENVTFLNGVPVNDLETGSIPWNEWNGLNDVFRNRELTVGLQPTTFSFGGIGGAQSLDTRAGTQRKQFQISYANTNRNYSHRLMATYGSGILKHGWAVSASMSFKYAKEGYVPGTSYNGHAYFLAVQKYFGTNHSLNLTLLAAPTTSAGSTPATKESFDLAGSNYYNPNWGWWQGKKRNIHERTTNMPTAVLTHEWKINNHESLVTGAGFTFGQKGYTAIDWNNAPDPRPDYYRYLPSYIEDSTLQATAQREFRENESLRQINWAGFYEANAMSNETIDSVDGIAGKTQTGKRARYILENRIQDIKKFDFASTYNNSVSEHIALSAGIAYQFQINHNYKKVKDLLGADFYVDVNQFAMRDFPDSFTVAQNDLNHPNRILYEGDKFGYNYIINTHHTNAWLQSVFTFNKIDFFAAAQLAYSAFWRDGQTRYGLFPDNSFGKSKVYHFINYAFKGGITYKINGRNYLYLNGEAASRAPYFENAFVSPRTRNSVVEDLRSEKIYSGELGYKLAMPKVKLRATLFFTQFKDQTKTLVFYNDLYRTFVNYSLVGIDARHWGGELGIEYNFYKGFSASAVASMGRYTYTSRPTATVTQDNSAEVRAQGTVVYQKNFNVSTTPQLAASFGLNYRSPQFWFAGVNFNYYDWMWVEFNPISRTTDGIDLIEQGSPLWKDIINQERLKGQFTMDFHAGYSWLLNNTFKNLKHRYFLVFNVTASNITNNTNFITGGREQLRFDFQNRVVNKFPPKYFYGYGATYFASVTFRMN